MLDKMKKIFELQSKMNQIKQELAASKIEAQTAGGKIKIIMNGEQKVLDIQIDDSLIVTPDKITFKKDLLECFNQAIQKSQKLASEKAKEITGLNLPGM